MLGSIDKRDEVCERGCQRSSVTVVSQIKGTMSAEAHAQWIPVEINLHTTRRGIFAFPPLQKLLKTSQQTTSVIPKESL